MIDAVSNLRTRAIALVDAAQDHHHQNRRTDHFSGHCARQAHQGTRRFGERFAARARKELGEDHGAGFDCPEDRVSPQWCAASKLMMASRKQRVDHGGGGKCAEQLPDDVRNDSPQRKAIPRRQRQGHRRIQMCAAERTREMEIGRRDTDTPNDSNLEDARLRPRL